MVGTKVTQKHHRQTGLQTGSFLCSMKFENELALKDSNIKMIRNELIDALK